MAQKIKSLEEVWTLIKKHTPSYVSVGSIDKSTGIKAFDVIIPKSRVLNTPAFAKNEDLSFTFSYDSGVVCFCENSGDANDIYDTTDLNTLFFEYLPKNLVESDGAGSVKTTGRIFRLDDDQIGAMDTHTLKTTIEDWSAIMGDLSNDLDEDSVIAYADAENTYNRLMSAFNNVGITDPNTVIPGETISVNESVKIVDEQPLESTIKKAFQGKYDTELSVEYYDTAANIRKKLSGIGEFVPMPDNEGVIYCKKGDASKVKKMFESLNEAASIKIGSKFKYGSPGYLSDAVLDEVEFIKDTVVLSFTYKGDDGHFMKMSTKDYKELLKNFKVTFKDLGMGGITHVRFDKFAILNESGTNLNEAISTTFNGPSIKLFTNATDVIIKHRKNVVKMYASICAKLDRLILVMEENGTPILETSLTYEGNAYFVNVVVDGSNKPKRSIINILEKGTSPFTENCLQTRNYTFALRMDDKLVNS